MAEASGGIADATAQPWAPDGRYGSDWSSAWGKGGDDASDWATGGPGDREFEVSDSDEPIASGYRGIAVKYTRKCLCGPGVVTSDNWVLVNGSDLDEDGKAPRIVNVGDCWVKITSLPAKQSKAVKALETIDLQPGATQEPWTPLSGTKRIVVWCEDCTVGKMSVTIERPPLV